MKKLSFLLLLLVSGLAMAKPVSLKPEQVQLNWRGTKVTGEHVGAISLEAGSIVLGKNGLVESGELVVNMDSITCTDLEGEWRDKLINHLKDKDFFDTKNHKTANLKIKNIVDNKGQKEAIADLTIKGITKPVRFPVTQEKNSYKGKMVFNRVDYQITYNSGSILKNLGDKMIHDNVEVSFEVNLK